MLDTRMRGEDVFALQTALVKLGYDTKGVDGIFGPATADATKRCQLELGITSDGFAGGITQLRITRHLADKIRDHYKLPAGLAYGQCAHESSGRLGNYSPQHSFDVAGGPYYDAGVAQFNVRFTPAQEAFDAPLAIDRLGKHLRDHYDLFEGVQDNRRRWELASGAWNAPAWAKWIARQEGATKVTVGSTKQPTAEQRDKLEAYMESATAYMVL